MSSSFDFTMTMPGDTRLVGAVRDLAVHAAKYAQLPEAAGSALAEHVAQAAATSIEATDVQDAPVEVRFTGDVHRLEVLIASDIVSQRPVPESGAAPGVTIDWSRVGIRQVCLIAHRPSS